MSKFWQTSATAVRNILKHMMQWGHLFRAIVKYARGVRPGAGAAKRVVFDHFLLEPQHLISVQRYPQAALRKSMRSSMSRFREAWPQCGHL